jgi:menaquinone-dependent protoporphyrinogen oxidase
MRILLLYGTEQGQTQKIAGFVAERLTQQGHEVMTADASAEGSLPDPRQFDAMLIAASVHLGRYQHAVIDFVREHRATISARANAFLPAGPPNSSITSPERSGTAPTASSPAV